VETNMRSIFIVSVCALALGFTSPASAQYRRYHSYSNGGWAAPLVGGLIVGGVLGAMANQPRYYANPPVVIEQPYRTECRFVPVYDSWGSYRGERRECYQVPIY